MRKTRRRVLSTGFTVVACGCLGSETRESGAPTVGSAIVANYHDQSHEVDVRLVTRDQKVVREQTITVGAGEARDATRAVIGRDIDAPSGGTFECSLRGQSGTQSYDLPSRDECESLVVKIGRFGSPDRGVAIYSGRCTDRSP